MFCSSKFPVCNFAIVLKPGWLVATNYPVSFCKYVGTAFQIVLLYVLLATWERSIMQTALLNTKWCSEVLRWGCDCG